MSMLSILPRVGLRRRLRAGLVAVIALAGMAGGPQAHAAALYVSPEIAPLLAAGRPAPVIVEFDDTAAVTNESLSQRRQRRQLVKNQALQGLQAAHHRARRDFSELPDSSLTLTHADGLRALTQAPGVARIFWDRPLHSNQTDFQSLIRQPIVAQVMGRQGAGVGIAVLDTGVDYTKTAFGSCTAPGVPAGTCRVAAAYEAAANDNALDSIGHGTEVAETALAVAPKANIIAVDVFNGSSASSSDIISGINWVIAQRSTYNIAVINLSLGDGVQHSSACYTTDAFYAPIRNARNAGIVVVAAAGNEGYSSGIASPACVASAVAVGAVYDASLGTLGWTLNQVNGSTGAVTSSTCWDNTTAADQITCFSDSGSMLDLLAPGAMISLDGSSVAGTSFAAPMVSGAIAVLKSQFTTETPSQLESRVINTGTAIIDPRNGLSRNRLDLVAAQGAPTNDNLAAATAISGSSGSLSSWNYNATLESGEPAISGQSGGHSVWFQWTAPASGTLTLNTQGSGIDTLLAVYSGSTMASLQSLASDDDSGGQGTSALRMAVTAGQTYQIAVDGKAGATGALQLAWSASTLAFQANLSVNWSLPLPASLTLDQAAPWALQVSNAGPQSVSDAQVTLTWPTRLNWTSGPSTCQVSGNQAVCSVGSLAMGQSVTLSGTMTAIAVGSDTITAQVSSAQAPDANGSDNSASDTTTVAAADSNSDVPLPAWSWLSLIAVWLRALSRKARTPPSTP